MRKKKMTKEELAELRIKNDQLLKIDRLKRDRKVLIQMLNQAGCFTVADAEEMGVRYFKEAVEQVNVVQSLDWLRGENDEGDILHVIYSNGARECEHCGLFTVFNFGMGDCHECHWYQVEDGPTTKQAAQARARRILLGHVTFMSGRMEDARWIV